MTLLIDNQLPVALAPTLRPTVGIAYTYEMSALTLSTTAPSGNSPDSVE